MKKNPFPGMNPYLERRWGDVHLRLCAYISAALQPVLPEGLSARAEEEVILETLSRTRLQRFEADSVVVQQGGFASGTRTGAAVTTVKPVLIQHIPKLIRNQWVQIIDTTSGDRVVTAIEILSPGNKAAGALNRRYRRKLEQYIAAGVNVVEIDLLRSSRKRMEIKADELPPERQAPYLVCIHRDTREEGEWEVYPLPLREPLPTIPIPCRETDADVPLSLQPLIDRIYVDGGHYDIDYSKPPEPRLSEEDRQWASEIVRAAGEVG